MSGKLQVLKHEMELARLAAMGNGTRNDELDEYWLGVADGYQTAIAILEGEIE
jgi:hypothetical protein